MALSVSKILLSGVALVSLSACAGDRGPGDIGTKDDIAVINHGIKSAAPVDQAVIQGADVLSAPATPQSGDFSASTEQAQAALAPAVEKAEPVMTPATAPQSAPTSVPDMAQDATPAAVESAPEPQVTTTAPSSSIYPAQDYAQAQAQKAEMAQQLGTVAQATAPALTPSQNPQVVPSAPAPVTDIPYPLDKNAAYSPKVIEAARNQAAAQMPVAPAASAVPQESAPQTETVSAPTSLNDPMVIQAVQKALAAKGGYAGTPNGVMDTDLLNAIIRYQAVNKLPITGGLNIETLKALGVVQ